MLKINLQNMSGEIELDKSNKTSRKEPMLKKSDTVQSIELSTDIMMMATPSRSATPTKAVKGKKPSRLNLKENKNTSKSRAQKKKPEWSVVENEKVSARIVSPRHQ